jgi:prepilin-type N-terminal cleavage/methylation domain-containing protein
MLFCPGVNPGALFLYRVVAISIMTVSKHPKGFFFLSTRLKRSSKAFTLVEVLLVVSLFAVISVAIYQTFSSGVKIWNYASKFFPEEDVLLSLERITHDVHNAFYYSLFEFKGDAVNLFLTTMVITQADPKSGQGDPYIQQMGRVRYKFDKKNKQILRQQADYGQAVSGQWQDPKVLAGGIENVSFLYLFSDKKRLVERPTAQGAMPAMIKIDIAYKADKEIRRMTRLIDIPSSLSDL